MAVFRIEKTRDYTVMSNHHLKDRTLTLKSKGLLSMMLSLPDEWNYTTRGLAAICREGVDSIGAALKELENHGYIRRTQLRDEKGKITDTEYVIYEMPQCEPPSSPGTPLPGTAKPYTENPDMGIPDTAEPCTENPAQLNTNQPKTDLSSTEISNPIQSNPPTPAGARMGTDRMGARECYREVILDNIEYSYLVQDSHIDREQLDEIVDLIVDTVCSARKVIRIAGDDYPAEVVKSRFMKLDSSHVQYVMDCIEIAAQGDHFDHIRELYTQMLRKQLERGNNGLIKTKYLTLTIEARDSKTARARFSRIVMDALNHFKVMGALAKELGGKEWLEMLHGILHPDGERFAFEWSWLAPSGLSVQDFIAPSSFRFGEARKFTMADKFCAVSFLQISAPEMDDRMLTELLDTDSGLLVSLHIRSMDQNEAIKTVKRKITDIDSMAAFSVDLIGCVFVTAISRPTFPVSRPCRPDTQDLRR